MPTKDSSEPFKAHVSSQKSLRESAVGSGSAKGEAPTIDAHDVCQEPPLRIPLATLFALVVLLLVIICVSAAPLAGDRGGWFYFYKEDLDTLYLRNLNLVPWDHFIQVGYSWHTNSIRQYASEHGWILAGLKMHRYAKIWVNLRYGDATQLTGGYTAAMLAISCLVAGVYLAVLLRCAMLLQRQRAVAAGAPGELRQAMISTKRAVRPLGPWLWPAALTMMVLLAVLLVTFYLLVTASFNYQTSQLVPGVLCPVRPVWAFWTALSAVFCWLAVLLLALTETWRQHVAAEKQKLWLAAAQQRQTGFPPRAHGTRSSARGTRSSVGLSSLTEI
ncbi:hypothetical protein WJX75_005297 [Coccomyxa subellipsoidea]|uniref:Uncharacterized protein n=1 Tax=Coccomyxa subellipsoidea TaxID=248742 RepID=A0ABR2YD75_9CHLO